MKMTLRGIRVAMGLSLVEVRKMTGLSINAMRWWEKGINIPNREKAQKLCDLYGVELEDIEWDPEKVKALRNR